MTATTTEARFTFPTEAERAALSIAREAEADPTNFATVAQTRSRLRDSLGWKGERLLTDAEARRLAFAAMAAIGQPAAYEYPTPPGTYGYRALTVGPYVGDAVRYVLRNVEHTANDRHVVNGYASAANVVTRITV